MTEHEPSKVEGDRRGLPGLDDVHRMVVESSAQGVWVVDRDGRTVSLNQRMAEMLGYEPAELRHVTFYDLSESDRVPAAVAGLQGGAVPAREVHEVRLRHRDGHSVEARVTSSPLASPWDEPAGALLLVEDLTELRGAESRAEEATRRFERMAQALSDCLWYAKITPSGEWVMEYVSPSSERIWGVPAAVVQADPEAILRSLVDEDVAAVRSRVDAACRTRTATTLVYRVRRPNGEVRWVEDLLVPENVGPDGSCHVTGLARDITGRRQLESQVTERQREQSLSLLAGGIAHDFNNILMAILGQTSVVRRLLDPGARGQAELRVVEQAAKRAADLCRQLLAYAGRGRFEVAPTDLGELVTDMRGLMKAVVPKEVAFDFRIEEQLPPVDADTTQMRQVIMNVVANAGESMRERGGTMTLTVAREHLDRPTEAGGRVEPLPPGEYVALRVTDQGTGMTEDVHARMFDPFFTTKPGGHGLGLAAVLGIVRGHGGGVLVTTAPDRGTSVAILLPASKSTTVPSSAPSQPPPPTEEKVEPVRILVVEDEPTVRNIVQRMLELSGHRVVLAQDGVEGLERFRGSPDDFDLAVLDLTMPRMNGIETMRALRAIRPSLPVLMTSGHAEEDSVQRVIRESELAAFIQKPYRYGELLGKIKQLLAKANGSGKG